MVPLLQLDPNQNYSPGCLKSLPTPGKTVQIMLPLREQTKQRNELESRLHSINEVGSQLLAKGADHAKCTEEFLVDWAVLNTC